MSQEPKVYWKICYNPECQKKFCTTNPQVLACCDTCKNRVWYLRRKGLMPPAIIPDKECRVPGCTNLTPLNKVGNARVLDCSPECARAWDKIHSQAAQRKEKARLDRLRIRSDADQKAWRNCPDYSVMDIEPVVVMVNRADLPRHRGW